MFSSLPELQKERGFPHPSRKKKLLKLKRESTCSAEGRRSAWKCSGISTYPTILNPNSRRGSPKVVTHWFLNRSESSKRARR